MATDDGRAPASFSRADAARVATATRYVEKLYRNTAGGAYQGRAPWSRGVIPVQLPATAIAAGTPGSPTSGTAKLYLPNSGGPGLTLATTTVTIYNIVPSATPTGNKTGYVTHQYGYFYLVDWVC